MWQDVDSLTNSEMSSIAILSSLDHLKSAIRDIQISCLQVTMEACPKNTTNFTGVHKMAHNRCVRVDRSALAFGVGVGRYCYQICHTMYLGF